MTEYTAIADIGGVLLHLLQETCVPEPIREAGEIGLCTQEEAADYTLALVLYEILPMDRGLFPANTMPLCLRYALTARSKAVPEARALEQCRVLGKAISALASRPVLPLQKDFPPVITAENLTIDEKSKAFQAAGGMVPAMFYSVAPVLIGIAGTLSAPRVRSTL